MALSGAACELSGWTIGGSRRTMTQTRKQKWHDMWVSKPIYESLPYFYLAVGAVNLAASMYLNHWIWPEICFGVGLFCLVAGLVVWLKRRDFRNHDRRAGNSADY